MELYRWLPPEGVKIVLVLFLSFLIGLEREEHKADSENYTFGGVRTFPLIGLIGYAIALLSGGQLLPVTLGFAVVAGFLMLSYWHKLESVAPAGVTTEMSGLATYLVGALVYHEQYWIATTLSVAGVFLLELKTALESLTKRVPGEEILTFTKFLLLTAVILPVLPNQEFGPFQINPFRTWLVVVAVSAVSYGSYVIGRLTKGGGVVLASILGGAYSSTVTTLVLARRAAREHQPHAKCLGGPSFHSGQYRPGVHSLRQGTSGQTQHGVGRERVHVARGRRVVQDDDRYRDGSRPLSRRQCARTDRPDWRTGASHVP